MPPLRIMPPNVIKTAFSAKAQKVIKHAPRPQVGDVYKAVTTAKPQKASILNNIKSFIMDLLRD